MDTKPHQARRKSRQQKFLTTHMHKYIYLKRILPSERILKNERGGLKWPNVFGTEAKLFFYLWIKTNFAKDASLKFTSTYNKD